MNPRVSERRQRESTRTIEQAAEERVDLEKIIGTEGFGSGLCDLQVECVADPVRFGGEVVRGYYETRVREVAAHCAVLGWLH